MRETVKRKIPHLKSGNFSAGLEAMDQLRFAIDAVDSPHTAQNERLRFLLIPDYTHAVEKFRWPVTMGVQGIVALTPARW